MRSKNFLVAVLALLVILGLPFSQSKAETTLRVLWFNDADESTVFEQVMADFLKANDITLDFQIIPFTDYEKKLKLMVAGGEPPDLARVTNNQVALFNKQLVPLNDKIENFEALASNYFESTLAMATFDGKVVAAPMEATANGMLVNKTYFSNAGIDIDALSKTWTWDDWVDAMKKAIEANEKCRFGLGYDFSPHRWSTLMYEAGGRFLNDEETGMNFVTPEVLDALNFFKMLHDEGLAPKSVWMGSENPQELFKAGVVACHIGGSWWINAYAKDIKDFEWAAVRMPKRKLRSSVPGGKFLGSFKGSENEDVALKVIEAFTAPERNANYCKGTFNLVPRGDVTVEYPARSEDFAVMADDLSVTPAYTASDWKSAEVNKIYSYIREQIVEGLLGNQTMEEAAQNIQDKGNSFFK
jgi:alpha-1,4-digalacturonate transport system substrate-binding protein